MEIRLLKPTDAKDYWELRLEALKQNPEAFATSYEEAIQRENPIERVAKNLSKEGSFTFGAFRNNKLVGVVTLVPEEPLKLKHRANIYAMYVSKNMRGLGIGKALLSEAINKSKMIESLEKINLTVVSSNEKAKRLYSQLGFKVFGKEEKAMKVNNTYYDEEHMSLFI